jgi:hypothetical protein
MTLSPSNSASPPLCAPRPRPPAYARGAWVSRNASANARMCMFGSFDTSTAANVSRRREVYVTLIKRSLFGVIEAARRVYAS